MVDFLKAAKRAARQAAMERRRGLDPVAAGIALTEHVLRDCMPPVGAVVAGFWPLAEEIDIRPLLHALHGQGRRIALPVTPGRGEAMIFRGWQPEDAMLPERFGTMRPIGEILQPEVLLIPLLAFDQHGGRLGYGGGFYDRTLVGLPRHFRLGCGFAAQQVDAVPIGPYDVPLDAVATEKGVIRCEE